MARSGTGAAAARLEAVYQGSSPEPKRAARYVLDASNDVALHAMRTVAARGGTMP